MYFHFCFPNKKQHFKRWKNLKNMQNIISKKDYYTKENEFANASVPYADYLEYMQSKEEIENADEYVVWQTGGGEDAESGEGDDEESSEPCGECAALDGQVFHYLEIPTTHEGCKCGTIPLKYHTRLERLEAEIEKLEKKIERERKKIELDKFKKSQQFANNIREAKAMRDKSRVEKYLWLFENFPTGGKYDIKYGKSEMEYAGNFNYGAMGRAAGLSETELKAGGGAYQIWSGTSDLNFYDSYFDDPIDQQHIQEGIDWYNANYGDISSFSEYNWNYGDFDLNLGTFDWNFFK